MTKKNDSQYDKLERRVAALEKASNGLAVSKSVAVTVDAVRHQGACRDLKDVLMKVKRGEQLPKIGLIKIVRALTGVSLFEAKNLVENYVL